MIKCNFENNINEEVYYLKWEVNDAKANVVISHGMVEHPARYDDLAKYLNSNGINVYGIYHIGHQGMEHFYHYRKFYWTMLLKSASVPTSGVDLPTLHSHSSCLSCTQRLNQISWRLKFITLV